MLKLLKIKRVVVQEKEEIEKEVEENPVKAEGRPTKALKRNLARGEEILIKEKVVERQILKVQLIAEKRKSNIINQSPLP